MVQKKIQSQCSITQTEKEILHYLCYEFLTIKQISIRRKTSVRAVYKIIDKLKKKGIIKKGEIERYNEYVIESQQGIIEKAIKDSTPGNIYNCANDYCYFCDYPIVHRHHIIPKSHGGLYYNNIISLCPNHHTLIHKGICYIISNGKYMFLVFHKDGNILYPNKRQKNNIKGICMDSIYRAKKLGYVKVEIDKNESQKK